MEPVQANWDALSESAKAFADLLFKDISNQEDLRPLNDLPSYSQLCEENKQLRDKVASLEENPPFKEKYGNLRKEFQKIAAERDSLSSQILRLNHDHKDYERLKSKYQETKGKLATIQQGIEDKKSSITQESALEVLYQGFKSYCDRCGVDIRRIPTNVFLQFQMQDGSNRTSNFMFNRRSKDNWTKINSPR